MMCETQPHAPPAASPESDHNTSRSSDASGGSVTATGLRIIFFSFLNRQLKIINVISSHSGGNSKIIPQVSVAFLRTATAVREEGG